jgi:hypothetical protein
VIVKGTSSGSNLISNDHREFFLTGSEGSIPVPFCHNKHKVYQNKHLYTLVPMAVFNLISIAEPNDVYCMLRILTFSKAVKSVSCKVAITWLQPLLTFFGNQLIKTRGGCLGFLTWPYSGLDFSWHPGSTMVMYMIKFTFEWYPLRLRQYSYCTRFLKWRIQGSELPRLRLSLWTDPYISLGLL